MDSVLNTILVKVTAEMNGALLAPVSEQDVKEAFFQLFPTKAPGRMVFRHIFSNDIGSYVVKKLLQIFLGF
jgi:hypothetical protein